MDDEDLQREIDEAEKSGNMKRAKALDKIMKYRYIEYNKKKALKAQSSYNRKYHDRINVVS